MGLENKEAPSAEGIAPAAKTRKKFSAVYIGGGAFIQGIPARDLSKKEWDALSKEKQQALKDQGIVEVN